MGELGVFHIPVCPFSQRLEILLALKGLTGKLAFKVVDITKPREPGLLAKTRARPRYRSRTFGTIRLGRGDLHAELGLV